MKEETNMTEETNRQFETGAQRDTGEGKLRMSLVPQSSLKRVMKRYLDGAEKYGENNWMKGMPMSVFYDCAYRHLTAWWAGETDEDHAAAVVWNMLCAMWTEDNSWVGEDPTEEEIEFQQITEDMHKFPR